MNSIVLTDYKSIARTIDMCERFNAKINEEIAYIIVDNSAEECGRKYLEDNGIEYSESIFRDKKVYLFSKNGIDYVLIDSNVNSGYAIGNNLGAGYAGEKFNSEYYIFSNSDLAFPEDLDLSVITKTLHENANVGIIGPNVLYKGRSRQNPKMFRGIWAQMIAGDFNSRWFHCKYNDRFGTLVPDSVEGKADWVMGCFMIVSAAKFDEVGGFDEHTFLYGEEMILSRRMLAKGYINYYQPALTIIHDHSGVDNYKMRKMLHKSLKYYYRKYVHTNIFLLLLSDISFYITEFGYFLYHDLIKVKLLKKS